MLLDWEHLILFEFPAADGAYDLEESLEILVEQQFSDAERCGVKPDELAYGNHFAAVEYCRPSHSTSKHRDNPHIRIILADPATIQTDVGISGDIIPTTGTYDWETLAMTWKQGDSDPWTKLLPPSPSSGI